MAKWLALLSQWPSLPGSPPERQGGRELSLMICKTSATKSGQENAYFSEGGSYFRPAILTFALGNRCQRPPAWRHICGLLAASEDGHLLRWLPAHPGCLWECVPASDWLKDVLQTGSAWTSFWRRPRRERNTFYRHRRWYLFGKAVRDGFNVQSYCVGITLLNVGVPAEKFPLKKIQIGE